LISDDGADRLAVIPRAINALRRRIDRFGFGRLVGVGQADGVGAQRVESDRLKAVVPAERV
jgi:hypothetical protein